MTEFGYFLSSEEYGPAQLVDQALGAAEAGFSSVLISDHFHPWVDRQGQSPFVWSVIGAIAARTDLRITSGVTCPTTRIHPAVIAQAAATSQLLARGRFRLGVGSGEKLNEHILGAAWPEVDTRLEMLEEAIEVMRELWRGQVYSHHGRYYTVEDARIYSLPDVPPPILVSGFGPKAIELAARVGDGFVTTKPLAEHIGAYRSAGGDGVTVAACKVCYDEDEKRATRAALELWPNSALEGEASQELPMPAHFEQLTSHVTEEMITEAIPCGPDPERHVKAIRRYVDAGFDEVYIAQVGGNAGGFFDFFNRELRGQLS